MKGSLFSDTRPALPSTAPRIPRLTRPARRPYIPAGCDQQGRLRPTHPQAAEAATDVGCDSGHGGADPRDDDGDHGSGLPGPAMALLLAILLVLASVGAAHLVAGLAAELGALR